MTVRDIAEQPPDGAVVWFSWDANGPGTMTMRWADGLVRELVITFG